MKNTVNSPGKPAQLSINGQYIPPNEAALYRLFARDTLVGAYEFTWHHNIPWNELRESWDIIITFCRPEIITRLFDLYARDHVLAKTSATTPAKLLQKILALREAAGPAQADDAKAGLQNKSDRMTGHQWLNNMATYRFPANRSYSNFNAADHDALPSFICWDGWNLVEGPSTTIRTEDPGEAFDDFSAADPDPTRQHRYGCVMRLHSTLTEIIDDFNANWAATPCHYVNTTIKWSKAMDETLKVCDALTSDERKAIFYTRDMWAPVSMWGPLNKAGATGDPLTVQVNSVTCWRQAKRGRV